MTINPQKASLPHVLYPPLKLPTVSPTVHRTTHYFGYFKGSGMVQSVSSTSMTRNTSSNEMSGESSSHRLNHNFMRKIPPGAEASNILVGEVDFLEKTLSAFVRLREANIMGDLTEVPVPTR